MSVRNRPRNGAVKDEAEAHEEINMWNQIKKDLEKLSGIQKRQMELGEKIKKKEAENKDLENMKKLGQKDINELEALYRELLKLSAEENRMLNEEPTDLIKNVEILKALSEASAREVPAQRASAAPKPRKPKPARSDLDGAADSPAPSPSVQIPAVRIKGSSVRSGSVSSTRDGRDSTVKIEKIEDGYEGSKGSSAERAGKFFVGAEVAYKQTKPKEDGSQWILCILKNVSGTGDKKRYEIQDAEPDEKTGDPSGPIYRTSATALLAIPTPDTQLPDYPVGKTVLACYPDTTTFYKAEVMAVSKDTGTYRLKFEGEDDQNMQHEVDRRYMLDLGNR